jgi:hypothetical protein
MLIISIIYSWQLNKKISELRSNKKDLLESIKILDNTILRAEYNIDELKILSNQVGLDLNNKIDKAKYIHDDLSYLTDRATISSEKLDSSISEARRFEKVDFVQFHKEQLEKYKITTNNQDIIYNNKAINNFDPAKLNNNQKPIQKIAIESLLDRISAVKTQQRDRVI